MKALAIFGRSREPVTYEVRLEVDPSVIESFDEWLLDHVREMLAFPGFQSAAVYRPREFTGNRVVRVVVYGVRSRRELSSYLHTHAPRMRKEGIARFGRNMSASRRIMATSAYTLPDGLAVLFDEQAISGGLPICGNCRKPVAGRFCAHCGQEDRTFMLSTGELVYEFIGDLVNFDSRLFATLKPLLFRPGMLTADYIFGRRQQYLPPVRMYIFISLLFFFFATLVTDFEFSTEPGTPSAGDDGVAQIVTGGSDLTPEQRAEVERALRETNESLGLPPGSLRLPEKTGEDDTGGTEPPEESTSRGPSIEINGDDIDVSGFGDGGFEARIARGARALQKDPKAFARALMQQVPTMMFFFLPLIALMLKFLYIGSGRYYVEHLIFTLHYHSAVFVLLFFWLLFQEARDAWTPLQPLSPWITAILWIYIPVYLYKSLRRVYGQGHIWTSLKVMLLFFGYVFSLSLTLSLAAVYTMYLQA